MKWPAIPLSNVLADARNGTWGSSPEGDGNDLPVLRSTNIHNASLVLDNIAFRSISERSANRYQLQDGDIIVTTSSGSKRLIGKNALFQQPKDERRYLFSNFTLRLRPRPDVIIPRYLHLYLNSSKAKAELLRIQSTTSGLRNLNVPLYLAQTVPLPSTSEQRRIVEILDQADALRKKRAEADAKAARILPALFYKMFGDPATNPKGWDTGRLGDVILETQYGTSTRANTCGDGLPVLRMNNIDSNGYLDLTDLKYVILSAKENEKYALTEGDILFNRTNSKELVGKTGLWRGEMEAVAASYLIRVRVDQERAIPEFIWAYMNCPFIKQMLLNRCRRAIGMANINAKELRNLPLILPKRDRQVVFAGHLSGLEQLRRQQKQDSKAIERLFDTLLYRAFTGDLTAQWREAHMKELLAEMEQQAKVLEAPVVEKGIPKLESKRHAGHDMYNKAVLAAYITDTCHAEDRPLGRVKLAKLFYLAQRKAEFELTEQFALRAAGPVDDDIHKFLSLARKQKWVVLSQAQGDLKPVRPGKDIAKGVEQATKMLGTVKSKIDEMLDHMKDWGWRALERWATVLHAAEEIAASEGQVSVVTIKKTIDKHPEWQAKLDRAEFSDENLASTLKGLRKFGFIRQEGDLL